MTDLGSTSCPRCGTESKIYENYAQATRTEPMRFLGHTGYCPKCAVSFKVAQLHIAGVTTPFAPVIEEESA